MSMFSFGFSNLGLDWGSYWSCLGVDLADVEIDCCYFNVF